VNGPRLEGERVVLRPIAPADNARIVEWRNRPDVRRNIYNQPPLTLEKQSAWYARYLKDESQARFVIEARGSGPAGVCGLTDRRSGDGSAALASVLGEESARGKGAAREALELLLGWGFREWGLHRVTAEVFAHNAAAVRLYEKLGFAREGVLRQAQRDAETGKFGDVVVMGLLAAEWQSRAGK
jgi:RimJ/RimL family protein N-acetyltransferase